MSWLNFVGRIRHYGAVNTKPKGKAPASKQPAQKLKVRLNSASPNPTPSKKSMKQKKEEPFQTALFKQQDSVSSKQDDINENAEILEKRKVIEKAWSQVQMLRHKEQSLYEKNFLDSKHEAMEKLKELSPSLYSAALKIDYSLPPVERRLPTSTPPKKLPFSCSFSSQ